MAYINDLLENHTTELSKFKSRIGDILPKFRDDFYRQDVCIFKFLVGKIRFCITLAPSLFVNMSLILGWLYSTGL